MCNLTQRSFCPLHHDGCAPMVESNNEEERFARIEQMIEQLQREAAANKLVTGKLVIAVAALTPKIVPAHGKV
jgi:Flp pilus assembly CpaF family ATPase